MAKALRRYGAVFSAWDGSRLAGLVAAMDDGTMTAYVHYLLVHPRYQGCGVGSVVAGYVQKTLCRVFAHSSHFLQGKGSFLRKEWFPSGPDAGGCAFDSSYVRRNRD
ncbi:MAG: GNAT family N-acetyltransferase [Akkermansia muciniphila]